MDAMIKTGTRGAAEPQEVIWCGTTCDGGWRNRRRKDARLVLLGIASTGSQFAPARRSALEGCKGALAAISHANCSAVGGWAPRELVGGYERVIWVS